MKEIWRKVPNFSRYEISNIGKIRSLSYKNTKKIRVLKPAISGGYFKTMLLNDNGMYKTILIHRLVMLSFKGYSKLEVNHKDGNKLNNKIDNLEYCTRSENQKHAFKLGLQKINGSKNPFHKLTEEEVKEIRLYKNKHGKLKNRKELAKKYNVSEACLKDIASGRRNSWSHVLI